MTARGRTDFGVRDVWAIPSIQTYKQKQGS